MPYGEPDASDPSLLVGVSLPADATTDLDMAYVFAEEFARMGFDEERLLGLFRRPFYAGAHRLWQSLGEETIFRVARESLEIWGRMRCVDRVAPRQELIQLRLPHEDELWEDEHEHGV
jgi:hypothetical protein